ncbi:Protein farnesyltransferase/geranylgeranyltransferase type-1 subunit alpha [Auxenochlorella protothecoides]|uniref:Protein farnesyltransferase/geranylgeranyltransferase type-1 subunit alpha n=1 Tax=Auxenochlorella protothecoides TaxID=3075 RepID=A0A087STL3_AUXPR|nr:Protein farnesyltransferase/geranylgeranyltransferase type-1 subunit alpha [Auxenochlorella protothecoides]KFM29067.1 Protein farnesyltransferase/geranylgeranyltransferase type-1 subunit alpha [Auxenochlorella protothecoides]
MPEITIEEVEGDAAQAVDLLSDSHWRDLAPLPYPPLPQPVVEIDMDEETALLMGRFWAVKTAGELSERAVALTEHIILHINGAHYTVWEWRWRCVLALRGKEVGDVEESGSPPGVADTTPWPSASGFPTASPAPALEAERELHAALAFTGACLALDAKNYHAWAHRQAVVAAAWEESVARAELEATRQLLGEDPRNNSAWSYRIEMDLVRNAVHAVPSSQSAWAYALGLRPLVPAGALNQGIAALARQVLGAAPWSLAALRALRRAEGP